ncbi:MAG: GTP-binding protein [Candidatus Thermoplasmatota archaeon]
MDSSLDQQIKAIEEEIFKTQKNKATEHHIGKLKAKMARLKEEAERRKSSGAKGKGFSLKKSGDATVGIVGFPSVGKSTLLNQLTEATSKVGDYDFTTLEAIPGMMKYQGAEIQLLDLPGLIVGAAQGKGRGREVISAIRNVDLVLFLLDPWHLEQVELIEKELYAAGLRLNQKPPDVIITKKAYGGITLHMTTAVTHMSEATIRSIISEFVINADITIREDVTEDRLIDAFAQNRVYVPALIVVNKKDIVDQETLSKTLQELEKKGWKTHAISAKTGDGLPELQELIFRYLNLIRVYMKPVGKKADYTQPLILKKGSTIEKACQMIHKEFLRNFRYATVWGSSAKHAGQKVGLDHILHDRDVLTIVLKK